MCPPETTRASARERLPAKIGPSSAGVVWVPSQFLLLEQHGMDVPLEMIDGDQRLSQGECQRLGIGDANQERAGEPRSLGDGNGGEVGKRDPCFRERGVDHGNDVAQMLAGGQFGNHTAIGSMRGNL